jgi:hypothetical protein
VMSNRAVADRWVVSALTAQYHMFICHQPALVENCMWFA